MAEPPAKRPAISRYRWCPHCKRQVADRTYRSHKALYFPSGSANASVSDSILDNSIDGDDSMELDQETESIEDEDITFDNVNEDEQLLEALRIEEEDRAFFETSQPTDEEPLNNFSSSSEEESDHESLPNIEPIQQHYENVAVGKLIKATVAFLCLWQSVFVISDKALEILLKFLVSLIKALSTNVSSAFLALFSSVLPSSIYMLRQHANVGTKDIFSEYAVCPACFSIYKVEDCLEVQEEGEVAPIVCSYVKFPNHSLARYRKPCGSPLLKKIIQSNGKVEYRPKYLYTYQPLKVSLQRLLNRPGFAARLEQWRDRVTYEDKMADIYDGNIWKEFASDKYNYFLKFKRNYGLMLNFDFFQPYKHTTDSYGAIYLTLINLPRSERFKQENVILVGIIPSFEHEPSTLNPFLRPLVDELKEFWQPGVRLTTAESPSYKLLFKLALMCVACDIPAARKVCGFKGHSANYGCSRCKKFFPGEIGNKNFSGFDRTLWPSRSYEEHVRTTKELKKCKTQSAVDKLETATGVKYSIFTELPYFNPIKFTIIDPMHNLFLGTAKFMMKNIWMKNEIINASDLGIIQCRIDSMSIPSDMGRIPRKIASNFSGFTAEQLKNWVLLYSLYALRGIISQDEYHCWQAFVLACYLICRRIVNKIDIQKADLLFVKFCTHVTRIYGEEVVTPNMHLHCHIAECMKDYGTVYGFWCFSYERYNGILGNFPTNKKNVASQLMRRFIHESHCRSQYLHSNFTEMFHDNIIFPVLCDQSEIHRHIAPCLLLNCYDFSQIYLPSSFKTSMLSPDDFCSIRLVYKYMYSDEVGNYIFTRTIRILKSIRLYGQQFGSMRDIRTRNSCFVMAQWAKKDGSIYSETDGDKVVRPGKVLYYILNKVQIDDNVYRDHLFAIVGWLTEHPRQTLYGKPMEIWDHSKYIEDGPASFLPIHEIMCRFVSGFGRVSMPNGGEDQVMFVCPIPNFGYF